MSPALPDDILHLLCEQLADQEQFDTLFNCATASRALAVPALTHLYRYVLHALICRITSDQAQLWVNHDTDAFQISP